MQDQTNRPSQKSYTLAKFGQESAVTQALGAVEDALILNPKMPAVQLAELLIENADEDITRGLHLILERQFYRRAIRAHRMKQSAAARAQLALPGFEHLPLNITGPKGAPIPLLDANTRAVRQYLRGLMKDHRDRRRTDPKIQEAQALLAKMQKAAKDEQGITVRQVLLLG